MNLSTKSKSLIITILGYIITSLTSLVIYPLFGIPIVLSTALYLGIIFTALAFANNYLCLKYFEYLEKEKDIE